MSTDIVHPQFTEDNGTNEQSESLVEIRSDNFTPYVLLHSCLKEKLLKPNGAYDPSQERAISNEVWRLVEQNNISVEQALKFTEAKPEPIPQSKKALDNWWNTWQQDIQEAQAVKNRYRSAAIGEHGVTICSVNGQEITVPYAALQGLSETIEVAIESGQEKTEQGKGKRHRALVR